MSESKMTLEEFVKKRREGLHDEAIRLRTLKETAKNVGDKFGETYWSWIEGIFSELEESYNIIERLIERDRYTANLLKVLLGLDVNVKLSEKEVKDRAEEFGELVKHLIKKRKQWELEEKEKEKWR